jgi:2-methylcitrate dehydratase PrpD
LGRWRPSADNRFFNGFAFHCLEWDAVHEPAVVHALSVVSASLLAASDRMGGSDPEAFLTALCIGVDVASGIGLAATGPMRFFRPATAGIIGAALAVARMQGMSTLQMANVLGLAYTQAAGTMQAHVEASIALPLQIGHAARAAITAVDLASVGMDGPHDALEGSFGYSALIEPLELARYTSTLGKIWHVTEVSIKPFPCGRASHGALGALQNLRRDSGIVLASVAGIDLFAPPLIHRLVGRPYRVDMTPAYARLCLPFLAPLMLSEGVIDPQNFNVSGMANPAIAALAGKVNVVLDGNADGNALGPQTLIVTLKDNSKIERIITNNPGSPNAPMSASQSTAKYDLCHTLSGNCDPRVFSQPLRYATDPQ